MKVILAYRCAEEAADRMDALTVPAGLRWMAASLRAAGHQAFVANFSRLGWKDIERYLAGASPDLVGVTCLTSNRATAARLARVARRTCPGVVVAMGGPHASTLTDLLLRRVREIDFIVVGEGEGPIVRACDAIAAAGLPAIAGIPGIAMKGVPALQRAILPDPDALPRPVVGLEGAGLDPSRDFRDIVAARERPGGTSLRSPRSVAREMEELRDEFGVIDVSVVGPGLLRDAAWLDELAGEMLESRIAATWDVAADAMDLVAPGGSLILGAALRRAHLAGCRRLRVSLDASTVQADLAAPLSEASRLLRASGVAAHLTVRHGLAEDSRRSVQILRGLVRALQPREGAVEAREIFPGTLDWQQLAAKEGLTERFWFDESRAFIPVADADEIEVSEGALDSSLREVGRSARPASRDLEVLDAHGSPGAWGQVAWGDWRASHGDVAEAERHYRIAARLEPWNPFPWLRLAGLFARGRAKTRRDADPQREAAALAQVVARVPRHAQSIARLEELRDLRESTGALGRKQRRQAVGAARGHGSGSARRRRS